MDFTILHFAIHIVWRANVICTYRKSGIARKTTVAYPELRLAIKRDRKIIVPEYPQVKLHHYTASILELGAIRKSIDGYNIRIYDIERCVCDAIKFRNKVGLDVCSEVMNNYLMRHERNISKLMDYAQQLRVHSILERYLQVKLLA